MSGFFYRLGILSGFFIILGVIIMVFYSGFFILQLSSVISGFPYFLHYLISAFIVSGFLLFLPLSCGFIALS